MASFKITDLTELASGSVNDSDVLEIVDLDADESKKVTIASLKNVFTGEVTVWGEITGTLSSQTDLQSALDGKLNTTAIIDDLSDVDAASPSNGQALIFNSTSGNWESSNISDDSAIWGNISGTLSSQSDLQSALNSKLNTTAVIDDLSNVDAPSPSNGESLIYNSTTGNWEANTISTSTTWGSITGTLSSQTDLQSALNGKLNTTAVINDLSDIDAATPSNGQTLIYNSVSGNWENGSTSATSWGSITGTLSSQTDLQSALDAKLNITAVIDDLSDVDASAPSNGEALIYNSTSGNWESNTITTSTAWGDITGTLSSQTDLQSALNGKLDTTAVIDDLSDVSAPSPSNGQSLVYNSTSGNWEANTVSTSTAWGDITGTLSSQSDLQSALNGKLDTTAVIDDLSDVNAPTPSNGEALVYNSLSGNWESSVISTSVSWGSIIGTLSSQTDLQSALNAKLDTTAVINDISDINAASPSNGQALIYNSTSGDWENGNISNDAAIWGNITGTLSSQTDLQSALNGKLNTTAVIDDLSDVDAATPSNGETLIYNSTSGNWENGSAGGGVSEGDSYTGGTSNGIMFNDGNTFATSSNLTYSVSGGTAKLTVYHPTSPGAYWSELFTANQSHVKIGSDAYITSRGNGLFKFGSSASTPSAVIDAAVKAAGYIGYKLDLANGQTADALQINSYGNTGGDLFRVEADGSVGIGTTSPDASAKFQIDSTTQGALLPRMTTTERDAISSPATGLSIFNTTTSQPEYYSGTSWEGAAGGGGISIGDSIGGATNNAVLFVNGSGVLAQNSKFTFNGTTLNFTGGSSSNTSNSSYGVSAANSNFGSSNTSIGYLVNSNSTGSSMTSIGRSAGQLATSNESAFIGYEAGYQSNGNRSVFAGYRAGRGNTGSCVGLGDYALYNGNGDTNTAVGANSQNSSTGTQNTSIGARSLLFGNSNYSTGVGYQAGQSNTGNYVLALGYNAGNSNTQANRFIVGQQNLPQFAGAAAAAAALPAAGANGVYLYWDTTDNTIKARP